MSLSPRRWSYEACWMEMHGNTIKYVSLFMELQRFQLFLQHNPLDIVFFLSIQNEGSLTFDWGEAQASNDFPTASIQFPWDIVKRKRLGNVG